MAEPICYIKLNRNAEVREQEVRLQDVGSVRCADAAVAAKVKNIKIHHFKKNEENKSGQKESRRDKFEEKRCVISILKIIELIEETVPGVTVESLGENDVLIEWVDVDRHKGFKQGIKIILVAIISFFGTAFTIMAYHNDIGIADVFAQIHRIVMGEEPQGVSVLEAAYSIGLALGIILFFNHVGGRRLTKDPTPIEVEMRVYETDVNNALIETAEREGRTIDAS
ncbi:MAG: stage V sporulation protein AA [Lachnospiraceae bacterium]|nr:stage V sporulation protein AA [Lachnospiraceae bacterium]